MTDVEYRDPTQMMLRVQVGKHSRGMICAKHLNTACLQIIENFWAKHPWGRMSSLSTSHRLNKNGKLLRDKAASSEKMTSQQELPVHTLWRVQSFYGVFLLLYWTVYATQSQWKPQLQSACVDPNIKPDWRMWNVKEVGV